MSVILESTTDTPEQIQEAIGKLTEETQEEVQQETQEENKEVQDVQSAEESESEIESSDETEEESETSKEEQEQTEKSKGPKGVRNRIKKLGRKLSEKDREIEFLREQLRATTAKQEPKEEKSVVTDSGKPNPDNFESHEEYLEAMIEYKADLVAEKKIEAYQAQQKETQMKSKEQQIKSAHLERVQAFQEKTEDFIDVIESVDDIPLSLTIQQVVMESENGPELFYELAKNREELERINQMPAIEAARAMGRFEVSLNKPVNEVKKVTQTPPPIRPVKGKGSAVAKTIYDPDLPFHEYERLRRAGKY